METSFIAGLLVGNLIGFLIATLFHLASEIDDREEEIEIEKEGKNENNRW